jgi:predicted transcriptional regulator
MSKRYVELFFAIKKEKTVNGLARKSGMTISHLSTVTDQWVKEGLILKKRKGREADISITKKGEKLWKLLEQYDALTKEETKEGENEGKNKVVSPN